VAKADDVCDSYSPNHVLELAHRMGLLTRPEFHKLRRVYDIRRDLEHEDDEYEAGLEDLVYVFKSCIEIVLSRDPVELLRVADVQELIQAAQRVMLTVEAVGDYERAPDVRQREIAIYLVNTALNGKEADVVRQNAVEALRTLDGVTRNTVKIELANAIRERTKRQPLNVAQMKVAAAGGFLPYLKQVQIEGYFNELLARLKEIGADWRKWERHREPLEELEDVGGLAACPASIRGAMVRWLTECYIGEHGGYGMGQNRQVFYSNIAVPVIQRLVSDAGPAIRDELAAAAKDKTIKALMTDKHVARRYENLLDLVDQQT
jgi:hypothetical protein